MSTRLRPGLAVEENLEKAITVLCASEKCVRIDTVRLDADFHLDDRSGKSHKEHNVCQSLLRRIHCCRLHLLAMETATTPAVVS